MATGSSSINDIKISTFAVLDLETSNLPSEKFGRVGITELSIYAFSVDEIKKDDACFRSTLSHKTPLPKTPRVLHKLNLLFNPRMRIDPSAESITGLNNYNLEYESTLNENAATTIIGFIKHLQQPVCLVAHNGWNFDFPIVKQSLDNLCMSMPISTVCVDSLRAFLEIDEKRNAEDNQVEAVTAVDVGKEEKIGAIKAGPNISKNEKESSKFDWRARNETTPKRPTMTTTAAHAKRKLMAESRDGDDVSDEESVAFTAKRLNVNHSRNKLNTRRELFADECCFKERRFPPKNVYKLSNLIERIFAVVPTKAHQAEADVQMLTKLIQHYGIDFLAFAESQAVPFKDIKSLRK